MSQYKPTSIKDTWINQANMKQASLNKVNIKQQRTGI